MPDIPSRDDSVSREYERQQLVEQARSSVGVVRRNVCSRSLDEAFNASLLACLAEELRRQTADPLSEADIEKVRDCIRSIILRVQDFARDDEEFTLLTALAVRELILDATSPVFEKAQTYSMGNVIPSI